MYESAFDNLQSSYTSNDNHSGGDSLFSKYSNDSGSSYSQSESIFSQHMKSVHLKGVSESNPFASQSIILNGHLDNKSNTMYANNQNSIDHDKSIYFQNGELESDRDTMGVLDRSRNTNESINIDQTKQVSLQGRFTNTNTVEDMSLIGDRDSARTLQSRRTNTNSVEDNSVFNDESVTNADDFHRWLDEGKPKKKEAPKQQGSMALLQMQEEAAAKESGNQSEDDQRAAIISHAITEQAGGGAKPKTSNMSSMDEDENEKNSLKAKRILKREEKNYNQDKYENVENDDEDMGAQITHTVQRTMSDYLSKY